MYLQEEKAERKSNNLQEKQQLEDIFWIVGGNSSGRNGHPDYYPYFYFFLRRPKTAAAAKITKPSKGEINSQSDNFYDQYCCQVRHYTNFIALFDENTNFEFVLQIAVLVCIRIVSNSLEPARWRKGIINVKLRLESGVLCAWEVLELERLTYTTNLCHRLPHLFSSVDCDGHLMGTLLGS